MRLENKYEILRHEFENAKNAAINVKVKCVAEKRSGPYINFKTMRYAKPKVIETLAKVGLTGWEPKDQRGVLVIEISGRGEKFCGDAKAKAFSDSLKEHEIESGIYYKN